MNTSSRFVHTALLAGIAATAAVALTGCYVVPLQPHPPSTVVDVPMPAPAPGPVTFSARLYPAN
jgi:hypothetical protein